MGCIPYKIYTIHQFVFFSIYVHVCVDAKFEQRYGLGHKIIHKLFYGRMGLQNLFNLKGLKLHINFEVVSIEKLGYETYPSIQNLRYVKKTKMCNNINPRHYNGYNLFQSIIFLIVIKEKHQITYKR